MIWDDFCSWYLEWIKPGFEQPIDTAVYQKTVVYFEELMQLLHPFMPFITEEIYHRLKERKEGDDLTIRQLHAGIQPDTNTLQQGILLKDIITGLRDARNKHQLKPKDVIDLFVETENPSAFGLLNEILCRQVNASALSFTSESISDSLTVVIGKEKFYIRSGKEIDPSQQRESLLKELEYYQGFLAAVDKKLSNERFVQNAKPEVVELERRKKEDAEQKMKIIQESLRSIS